MAMIVIDINLLLHAYDRTSAFHRDATRWFEDCLGGSEPVGLTWSTICGFLRIATHPRVPGERFSMPEALTVVNSWLARPHVTVLAPSRKHWDWLKKAIEGGQAQAPLISDAELAALTMEHGGTLYTNDRDFTRFPGLRLVNPLLA